MGGDGATMLMEVEGTVLVPSQEAAAPSPAGSSRGRASRFASSSAAALQRRLGAPGRAARRNPIASARAADDGARTRRQRSPAAPGEDAATDRPAPIREPEQHHFSGTVAVNAGPFEELDAIGRFAASLSSVPGVGGVRIRTFDGRSVIFDVDLDEPTPLLARLRSRSPLLLRLQYANERVIRLKLV